MTLFAGPGCRGRARTITLAAREPLCTRCFDLCRKFFDGGGKMHDEVSQPHSKVASLRVMEPTGGGTAAAASLAVSASIFPRILAYPGHVSEGWLHIHNEGSLAGWKCLRIYKFRRTH